jgi:hypothetical protein
MPPYVPRQRVGDQMLCTACVANPRGGYVSASLNNLQKGSAVADPKSFEDHFNEQTAGFGQSEPDDGGRRGSDIAKDSDELHERYKGQPGTHGMDESDFPHYQIDHPSGWHVRTHGGPYLEVGHQAVPDAQEAIDVSNPDPNKGGMHPAMTQGTPEENHNALANELSHFVQHHGEEYAQANPKIKQWQQMRGVGNTAMRQTLPSNPGRIDGMEDQTQATASKRMQKQAHDSGDGETIYHCPFCGSGQVIARSDKTIECEFCFAGETEFITSTGIQTLEKTVGTTQRVLVSQASFDGRDFSEFGGRWVDAEIKSFGVQSLMKVTLRRAGEERVIYATPEHRWLITPMTNKGFRTGRRDVVLTKDLVSGSRLAPLFAQDRLRQGLHWTTPSPFGIAHGFAFGDGSTDGRGGSKVTMWGDKDLALLPYFPVSELRHHENVNGTKGIEVKHLPRFFKERPSLNESLSYLYGWLAGYFAADGSVSETGVVQLHCADPDELDFVRAVCTKVGIATLGVRTYSRQGFGDEPSDMSRITFVSSTLTTDFFIIPEHRARYMAKVGRRTASSRKSQDHTAWKVFSVDETDRVEAVYCAVVPGYENFTLAENINVMNCHTCFTVQVQPEFSAFPQTINGMPVDVPGMPGQVGEDPSAQGPVPQEEGADGEGEEVPPPQQGNDGSVPNDDASGPGGDDSTGGNPFTSRRRAVLHTGALRSRYGYEIPVEDYLSHLALAASTNRQATLEQIRARRSNGPL